MLAVNFCRDRSRPAVEACGAEETAERRRGEVDEACGWQGPTLRALRLPSAPSTSSTSPSRELFPRRLPAPRHALRRPPATALLSPTPRALPVRNASEAHSLALARLSVTRPQEARPSPALVARWLQLPARRFPHTAVPIRATPSGSARALRHELRSSLLRALMRGGGSNEAQRRGQGQEQVELAWEQQVGATREGEAGGMEEASAAATPTLHVEVQQAGAAKGAWQAGGGGNADSAPGPSPSQAEVYGAVQEGVRRWEGAMAAWAAAGVDAKKRLAAQVARRHAQGGPFTPLHGGESGAPDGRAGVAAMRGAGEGQRSAVMAAAQAGGTAIGAG
ncbi:unnamed protein product [Closterium sp. NIES-64]|nr:unnamed protein product [Closterium sp. NIES-64]